MGRLFGCVMVLVMVGCGNSVGCEFEAQAVEVDHFAGYAQSAAALQRMVDDGWSCVEIARVYDTEGRERGVRYECSRC